MVHGKRIADRRNRIIRRVAAPKSKMSVRPVLAMPVFAKVNIVCGSSMLVKKAKIVAKHGIFTKLEVFTTSDKSSTLKNKA
jgi:hypothetical protein